MKPVARYALFLVSLIALTACQATPPPAPPTGPATGARTAPASVPAPGQSSAFSDLINAERARAGVSPVRVDPRLAAAARAHAQDMDRNGYFSHSGLNGSNLQGRAVASGYCRTGLAENIAFGQRSEAQVFQGWLASAGHRRNMLRRSATEYGLGESGGKWVLLLGDGC